MPQLGLRPLILRLTFFKQHFTAANVLPPKVLNAKEIGPMVFTLFEFYTILFEFSDTIGWFFSDQAYCLKTCDHFFSYQTKYVLYFNDVSNIFF